MKDEYYYNIIRKNIHKYRIEKKMTQQELANKSNISKQYINKLENGNNNCHITLSTLGKIADALEIDIRKFFID